MILIHFCVVNHTTSYNITDLHDRDDETSVDHKLTEIGRSLVAGEKSETQFQQTQKEEVVHYTPVPAMPDQESADVSELSD